MPPQGEGGAGGADGLCDCGDDPMFIHAPLECACANGECETLDPNPKFESEPDSYQFGRPFVVLYGTCASGHRVIAHQQACENRGRAVYDEQGQLVYSSYGPYGSPPAQCRQRGVGIGDFGIGESDPSQDCDYCVIVWYDERLQGMGGADAGGASAGGAGNNDGPGGMPVISCILRDLEMYPPCGPELYK
jgi:hypothetical protein